MTDSGVFLGAILLLFIGMFVLHAAPDIIRGWWRLKDDWKARKEARESEKRRAKWR